MNEQSLSDLRDFHRFIADKLNNGGALLSPEDVLDEWRIQHPGPETVDEDVAAIEEAIDDMENGDTGVAFEEFDRDFRARRNLPTNS